LFSLLYSLFSLVNQTNKKLTEFLLNIRYDDYEAHYSSESGEITQKALSGAFNVITDKFRHMRQEKEAQYHFLNNIVENVDTGLICFEDSGETLLMNPALKRVLHKSYIPNMESLSKVDEKLFEAMHAMGSGEKTTVQIRNGQEAVDLSIRKSTMKLGSDRVHLFVLSDIRNELEEQEMAAWQKLIRILTHEIMNTVAPVASLASTADAMIVKEATMDPETREEIHMAVRTIQKRSEGLLDFTEKYRSLTKLPVPKFQAVELKELLDYILVLFSARIQEQGVTIEKYFPHQPVMVNADPALLEQAIINLIKNGLDALEDITAPKIQIAIRKQENRTAIEIADNGPGIPADTLDQIFVPFFTTKESGSGIGLSLARQILHLHKGTIACTSEVGKGTLFTVVI
jgi:nitrogen fixation/metabolism regulation signal transduction histidine kinase